MYFYIFSSAILNETFTAKYTMAFCREHPKRDQNPKFTPLKGPPPPSPPGVSPGYSFERKHIINDFLGLYFPPTNCIYLAARSLVDEAWTRNQSLFCKKDAFRNTGFSRLKCQLKQKKKLTQHVSKDFSSFNLNLFQIRACVISARKAKHVDVTTMFTYS